MKLIEPNPDDSLYVSLEDVRENLIVSWGENEYYQQLEKHVKDNHSDIFKFMEEYPTYSLGYSVISELYRLEETIYNLKHQVLGYECDGDFHDRRSVKNKPE